MDYEDVGYSHLNSNSRSESTYAKIDREVREKQEFYDLKRKVQELEKIVDN
jgi:hypothetical protein